MYMQIVDVFLCCTKLRFWNHVPDVSSADTFTIDTVIFLGLNLQNKHRYIIWNNDYRTHTRTHAHTKSPSPPHPKKRSKSLLRLCCWRHPLNTFCRILMPSQSYIMSNLVLPIQCVFIRRAHRHIWQKWIFIRTLALPLGSNDRQSPRSVGILLRWYYRQPDLISYSFFHWSRITCPRPLASETENIFHT